MTEGKSKLPISSALWHRYVFVSRYRLTHKYIERRTTKKQPKVGVRWNVYKYEDYLYRRSCEGPNLSKKENIYLPQKIKF